VNYEIKKIQIMTVISIYAMTYANHFDICLNYNINS